jgi:serine/threonine protein kinase
MGSLDHPNITKIIDFDEQPLQLSIIMEFLDGQDLNKKIKRNGALSDKEISHIFFQTLSAFQYAHEKGIVHRDIKPSNIFILPNGHVKILDFGIAKIFGLGNESTQTGAQLGTPKYMSPEQIKADKSIDHRSDIYSLGVTMFYAVNGQAPFNSDTDSQFELFTKIVYDPFPDFIVQSKFRDIVLKACQKNREDRFQSCEEWLKVLNDEQLIRAFTNSEITILDRSEPDMTELKNEKNRNNLFDFKFEIQHQEKYSRLQLLSRSLFGVFYMTLPHFIPLFFLSILSFIYTFIAFWSILFFGKYPKRFFVYQVNLIRWNIRLLARMIHLSDGYPSFGLNGTDENILFEINYPTKMSRIKFILRFLFGTIYFRLPHMTLWLPRFIVSQILMFLSWFSVLIRGKYPKSMHQFNVGTIRWITRIILYGRNMTEKYPPFSGRP